MMMLWQFILAGMRQRRMQSGLCILAIASSIALLAAIGILAGSINAGFTRNAGHVDLVAGAAGSKLQIVLSSLYQADVPTGNIDAAEADKITRHPYVRNAVPVVIGDSYRGLRLVGTTPGYLDLYNAQLARGVLFAKPFEVVAGADTNLQTGQTFHATHGLSALSDDVHEQVFTVTGVLARTGTVADRLLLTGVESIQDMHHHHDDHEGHADHAEHEDTAPQLTALLLQVKSPMAILNLPRLIAAQENGIAIASPAYEMTRLAATLGVSRNLLYALASLMCGLSMLMIFGILSAGMRNRLYDLTVLRVLGATRRFMFGSILIEGALLGLVGSASGILIGGCIATFIWQAVPSLQAFGGVMMPGFTAYAPLLLAGPALGVLAASIPAIMAVRASIADQLAEGKV